MKEWRAANRRLATLEQELEAAEFASGMSRREVQRRAAENQQQRGDLRKYTRTKSLVAQDKAAYRLQVRNGCALSAAACLARARGLGCFASLSLATGRTGTPAVAPFEPACARLSR